MRDSTFSSNVSTTTGSAGGGAVFTQGPHTFTVTNSTFSGNSANNGGAIDLFANSAVISNSTFFGNSATTTGGGIRIRVNNSQLELNNSIVAGSLSGEVSQLLAAGST